MVRADPLGARQSNRELGELADPAIDGDRAAVLLGHDVVADREAEPSPLAGWLGGEEGLHDLILNMIGDTGAVIGHPYLNKAAFN